MMVSRVSILLMFLSLPLPALSPHMVVAIVLLKFVGVVSGVVGGDRDGVGTLMRTFLLLLPRKLCCC